MADNDINNTLTELERMEVERRRNKQWEESFRAYMESSTGKKVFQKSMERKFELLGKESKNRKPFVGKVIEKAPIIEIRSSQDESVVKGMKF